MDEAQQSLVREWLTKAQHDLAAARKLSGGPDPYLDVAIYHCQQAAEKAVKGFLVFHDQEFDKTHNVRLLVDLAILVEASFSSWLEVGARLTPYATRFRYPGEILEPEQEEFEQALESATRLYEFILSLLPQTVHPQT
jgi:HEPN domain-containing protein